MSFYRKTNIFCFCILLMFLYAGHYWVSALGMALGFRSLFVFLYSLEKRFPIMELTVFFNYLQLIIATFIYFRLAEAAPTQLFWFEMSQDEQSYMNFAVPGMILFEYALLHTFKPRFTHHQILSWLNKQKGNKQQGFRFIFVGLIASIFVEFTPISIRFIVLLFSLTIYIGIFYLWHSDYRLKRTLIFGLILYKGYHSLKIGMFYDFFVWALMVGFVVIQLREFKYKYKIALLIVALVATTILQSVKYIYRYLVWDKGRDPGIELYMEVLNASYEQQYFALNATAAIIDRLNQGNIVANIMTHNEKRGGSLKGEMFLQEFLSLFVPRFLYKDKLSVNTQEKFKKFTGIQLISSTTMSVSIFGDGYGNFGYTGGLIFIFFCGLFFSYIFSRIYHLARSYPSLVLWLPYIFFYTVRPGAEFYIITNWMLKALIMVAFFFVLFRVHLYRPMPES